MITQFGAVMVKYDGRLGVDVQAVMVLPLLSKVDGVTLMRVFKYPFIPEDDAKLITGTPAAILSEKVEDRVFVPAPFRAVTV